MGTSRDHSNQSFAIPDGADPQVIARTVGGDILSDGGMGHVLEDGAVLEPNELDLSSLRK